MVLERPEIIALPPGDAALLTPADMKGRVNGVQTDHAVAQSEFITEFEAVLEETRIGVRAALAIAPGDPDPSLVANVQNRIGEAAALLQQRLGLEAVELGNIDMALDAQIAKG